MLWAAVRATQKAYPNVICIIYTGDHQAKIEILSRVKVGASWTDSLRRATHGLARNASISSSSSPGSSFDT